MLLVVIVITETRYGGVYEGGPWAAFSVSGLDAVPDDAFSSGDPFASGWWDAPSVPVGVGDSPDQALERLRFLLARDQGQETTGYLNPDDQVEVASCAPDEWYGVGVGVVRGVEFRPSLQYDGGLRGKAIFTVDFDTAVGVRVPERYLRRKAARHDPMTIADRIDRVSDPGVLGLVEERSAAAVRLPGTAAGRGSGGRRAATHRNPGLQGSSHGFS